MKLENQVCSLELAKKLKELEVKQNSLFYWIDVFENMEGNEECWQIHHISWLEKEKESYHVTSAFTCGELGEMLPYYLVGKGELTIKKNYLRDKRTGWNVRYEKTINCKGEPLPTICGDIMANAMALMLIWLIENKMMEVGGDKN